MPLWSQAAQVASGIPERVHELCLKANDYLGCVRANVPELAAGKPTAPKNSKDRFGLNIPAESVAHERADGTISYFFPGSVKSVEHKGNRSRYITWRYTYHYYQQPTAGYWTPGRLSCTFVGTIKTCSIVGRRYVPGNPGGPRSRTWQVVGDCDDRTAKWLNDGKPWQSLQDRSFSSEQFEEANEVLEGTCDRVNSLQESSLKI